MNSWFSYVILCLLCCGLASAAADLPQDFFADRCLDCHDSESEKGDINLETFATDWSRPETERFWLKVLKAVETGKMPPENKKQPSVTERAKAVKKLHVVLSDRSRPGGSVLRRLNKIEYENSVRDTFSINYSVPQGFPNDQMHQGFDNSAEGLILSPPLMEYYLSCATEVADSLVSPPRRIAIVKPETVNVSPVDMAVSFEASQLRDGVLRLVTRNEVFTRSCTWPTRFEASHAGSYRFTVRLSAFKPVDSNPLQVEMLVTKPSMTFTSTKPMRRAAIFEVSPDKGVQEFIVEADLEPGETLAFYWSNASFGWDKKTSKSAPAKQVNAIFTARPKLFAAWKKIGGFNRRRTPKETWAAMKKAATDGTLTFSKSPKLPRRYSNPAQLTWALQNMLMEDGPALNIHGMAIHGPIMVRESKDEASERRRTERFLGERDGRSQEAWAGSVLQPLLDKAHRRPVGHDVVNKYVALVTEHMKTGQSFEASIHLAIRAILCSNEFLYRNRSKHLDDYDVAARLSYFLWSGPPDKHLYKLASAEKLSSAENLTEEVDRMLLNKRSNIFLNRFLDQWLDLRKIPETMPDERLIPKWLAGHESAILAETRMFVREIIDQNLPLQTFIEPGFTYLNKFNAQIYGRKGIKSEKMQRVAVPKGGRYGGILGQASVMMATANGVDTQPVLRGVWLAQNIFGRAPPEPPNDVPAIEPDTRGATTIREQIEKHTRDVKCASCHRDIDPLGFALENFDAIGQWREHYPIFTKINGTVEHRDGYPVDSHGILPDGTKLANVVDLKAYLTANIDLFSRCLAEKLLVYATGRELSYADQRIIDQIVTQVKAKGNGTRDLIKAIVGSDAFRVK